MTMEASLILLNTTKSYTFKLKNRTIIRSICNYLDTVNDPGIFHSDEIINTWSIQYVVGYLVL